MNCEPQPTDTPGIFRCPKCGLQNPRPIKKPFHSPCGKQQEPPELPPLRTQVVSFLRVMGELAADGFRLVDEEEFQRRVEICAACEDFFDRATGRCRDCGCFGNIKARGRVWECQRGKWQEHT